MKSYLIARNTFREATRDRVLVGLCVAGAVAMLATLGLSPLALGEGQRLTVDLGLSVISVLGMLAVLMVGTSLVAKEIDRRTIYNLLSRPIARPVYLVGKWAGLTAALWTVAVVLGLVLCGLLAIGGSAHLAPAILQAVYMSGLELSVVTAIAVMCSALSTPVLSALYTLGFYCVGQWSYDLRGFAAQFPDALGVTLRVVADVVPNLPIFNIRTLAASGEVTSAFHLMIATGYAVLYVGCVLALGAAAFQSRDFK
ncbi:MAG: ABC transporter permease [Candidatus Eisenbacteria bacterium]|uniref:ABC transporter permease n=1 Tax=Eiseniibacteriota bacterium TaxID=2212470 RepID=A0A849SI27_UNCEI|nr:ABC transporter permease [Candidatus Eisenbacteria bacterium]